MSRILYRVPLLLMLMLGGCHSIDPGAAATRQFKLPAGAQWSKLDTVAYKGKQDDIFFVDAERGWYVNGGGKIYRSVDGGKLWQQQLSQPGTFFRAVGFVDAQHGYAGNIGVDYFPGVTDTTPLYETRDGGQSWAPATLGGSLPIKGLCAIDILHNKFINSGLMEERTLIHAGGRVGGPAVLLRSLDGGASWKTLDMSAHTGMILDVKFFDAMNGLVFGASDSDAEKSHARIIRTQDGGLSWQIVYESKRPFELTWKASFPTRDTGYVTVQSYDPDPTHSQRYVAKTEDGGKSWREIPLVDDAKVREFGVGFIDAKIGWVGSNAGGYQTLDGGLNWQFVPMGRAVNKIRMLPTEHGFVGYAIGVDVYKLDAREPAR